MASARKSDSGFSHPGRRRVALLHYSAYPAVGGIETLLEQQCAVLRRLGHEAVCVVGNGSSRAAAETVRIRAMDPSCDPLPAAAVGNTVSLLEHPRVLSLITELEVALADCTDCWVLNLVTLSLHPFLACAVHILIYRRPDIRWVVWGADISSLSAFAPIDGDDPLQAMRNLRDRVTWVTISEARRAQLCALLSLPVNQVHVVYPPLDVFSWLDLGNQTRQVVETASLLAATPVVLVPAKLLPHKRLDRAVELAADLLHAGQTPRVLITAAASPHQPATSRRLARALRRRIERARLEGTVFLLPDLLDGPPSGRTVRELMQLADVVFIPSAEEGFGMPLREAALLRVPVVCADIPVFHEVAGEAASYFSDMGSQSTAAPLVVAATATASGAARRAVARSLQSFQIDISHLLDDAAQPKV